MGNDRIAAARRRPRLYLLELRHTHRPKSCRGKSFFPLWPRGLEPASACYGKRRLIHAVDCENTFINWATKAIVAGNFRHIQSVTCDQSNQHQ
ncbi:hypothetical protein C9E91_04845 [Rhizobium sp. SEMIA4064]|nr:hypothetical protein C9E91_04845 [Rhizobium sp. SEMIA4064]